MSKHHSRKATPALADWVAWTTSGPQVIPESWWRRGPKGSYDFHDIDGLLCHFVPGEVRSIQRKAHKPAREPQTADA